MKWKAKFTHIDYADGTTRLKRVFAWLPTYIDGYYIFFSTYEILQVYIVKKTRIFLDGKETIFTNGAWHNLSKRII